MSPSHTLHYFLFFFCFFGILYTRWFVAPQCGIVIHWRSVCIRLYVCLCCVVLLLHIDLFSFWWLQVCLNKFSSVQFSTVFCNSRWLNALLTKYTTWTRSDEHNWLLVINSTWKTSSYSPCLEFHFWAEPPLPRKKVTGLLLFRL